MTFSLILLALAFTYLSRRPKFAGLRADQFPGVPTDRFNQWRRLELTSIDIFVWSAFIVAAAEFILSMGGSRLIENVWGVATIAFVICLLVALPVSAVYGTRATALRRKLGIDLKNPPVDPHA